MAETDRPPLGEIATIARDPWMPRYLNALAPTDETLRQRAGGRGLGIYDEIRKDPQAHAVLAKRTLEVVSREWRVEAASDQRLDRKAGDMIREHFNSIAYDNLTRGLMGAVPRGYAVAEVIWDFSDREWRAAAIKVRKARRFVMTPAGELRLITRDSGFEGEAVPARKFIVHRSSIDDDDDDPYGIGLGSVLYWPTWFKRNVLAHWLRSSERFADPTVMGTYQGGYDKTRTDQILSAIHRIGQEGGIAVPDSVKLTLLETSRTGGDAHGVLIRYLDEMITVAVLGETLTTTAGDRGARSLGQVHDDIRLMIAKADADLISATLKASYIKWAVDLNYPGAGYPDVWRDFSVPEDLDKRAERDERLVGMGFRPRSADYINQIYGGDWVETKPEPPKDAPPVGAAATAGLAFADPVAPEDPSAPIADQLAGEAGPALNLWLARIGVAIAGASSYDDAAMRLLQISPDLDPADIAPVLEQALRVADLAGRAAVSDEVSS